METKPNIKLFHSYMSTQIKCISRLDILNKMRTLEKYGIDYVENESGLKADITPEMAWNIGLI